MKKPKKLKKGNHKVNSKRRKPVRKTHRKNMRNASQAVAPKKALSTSQMDRPMPLIKLPLYDSLNSSTYWYGLIPEIICIQGQWIQDHVAKLTLPADLAPYIKNAINQRNTALIVAGNDQAYFALYSLRAILERIAMAWTIHSESTMEAGEIVERLAHNDTDVRKRATQDFMELARMRDPLHKRLYDMVSRYFAHASKMDGVSLAMENEKDKMLQMRMRVMPLLLLLDVGNRLVFLIRGLLDDQGINYEPPHGGKEEGKFDLELYVRGCAYVMCEKHSPKKGVRMATLYKNMAEIKGDVGITTIYRGGMEVHRYGKPEDKPDPGEIADFCWYGIGKDHDDQVKVKCVEESATGERYELSWPKHLELDSSGVAAVAQHGGANVEFFDYISAFLKVLEDQNAAQ